MSKKTISTELLRRRWMSSIITVFLIAAPLSLAVSMGIMQSATSLNSNSVNGAYGGPYEYSIVDTFHEGETLGMAKSYQDSSKKPYKDFVFLHGLFQDPIRSVVAFKLFGESIGAVRTLATILSIVTFLLYYVLLLVIFERKLVKAAFGMFLLSLLTIPSVTIPIIGASVVGVLLPSRDIPTILFLISAILGYRSMKRKPTTGGALNSFLIGFIALAGFANSIDRAFYTLALSIIWLSAILIISKNKKLFLKNILGSFTLGAAAGSIILGWALKWDFTDFAKLLLTIGSKKEYLDGIIFIRPSITIASILIGLSFAITTMGALLIRSVDNYKGKLSGKKKYFWLLSEFIDRYFIWLLMLSAALIFMRSAIGRASMDHFVYSVTWLYLLMTVFLANHFFKLKHTTLNTGFITIILLSFGLIFYGGQIKRLDIKRNVFPYNISDKQLTRTDHWETAEYIRNNLAQDESFVTLTSEATWYYLVKKPSPVKYPIIWFAFLPKERIELAQSIENNKKIKFIITNNNWTSNFDYIPNSVRFPEVYNVLTSQYVPSKGFGQQTVWIRK